MMRCTRPARPLVLPVLLALAACTVGPDYRRPRPEEPTHWTGGGDVTAPEAGARANPAFIRWWTQFNDPELDRLVQSALKDNLDVQIAAARIAEARAQRDVVAGAALPTVAAKGQSTRYRLPDSITRLPGEVLAPAAATNPALPASIRIPQYVSLFQVGFDSSWELDLFGGTRRAIQAANASTEAAVAARRGVLVSILAEIGNDYVTLRATQQRILAAQRTLAAEQLLLELTQSRHVSGLASDLDVEQAEARLETWRAALPDLQARQMQSIHALAVLTSRLPEDLEARLSEPQAVPPTPPSIPVELPSELLESRPDIQQAERTLASATAAVGQAEAQRFPSLSLTAGTSLISTQLNQLLHRDNWSWNVGGSLTAPIFEGGRLAASERAAEAVAQQSALQYRRTVLQAFSEVEDSLRNYTAATDRLAALQTAARADQVALDRAAQLYRAGLGSYIDVLDADRTVASADDELALGQQAQASGLVAVYKALGGGWQTAP